jgi:pteridine reductase
MSSKKVALVTGSGKRRVGWHVADALGQCGYQLAVHYHSSSAEAAGTVEDFIARGSEAWAVQADVADESAVKRMIDGVIERFGRIDVLVNCAAIWRRKPLEEVTAADVRDHFDANALGTFLCCKHAGLQMVKQPEGGCIVNIGDWAEARPYLEYSAYFLSKGAVTALTRSMAVELGTRNPRVRVNCLLPGPVMFPPNLPETEKRQSIDSTLVKHEGSPRNIAQAVISLVENDFITGVCLPVDGGRTIYTPDS